MQKLAFILFVLGFPLGTSLHADPVKSVQSKDLGKSIQIIGVLDIPLGTIVTIEGEAPIDTAADADAFAVRVTKINGKPLDNPRLIGVLAGKVKIPKKGEKCIFRGFESGSFIGLPPAALKEAGAAVAATPWQFTTSFNILN